MRTLIAALAVLSIASVAVAAKSTASDDGTTPKHRAAPHCHEGKSKQCGHACIPLKRTCNITGEDDGK
jgi:hypothetical protein